MCPSSAPPTAAQMNTLAQDFLTQWQAWLMPQQSASLSVLQALADWNDGAGGQVQGAHSNPQVGSGATTLVPASTAMVLSWRISVRYRGGHPRTYMSGLWDATLNDAQSFTPAYVASVQTALNGFLAGINALAPAPFTSVTLGVLREFAQGSSELPHGAARYLDPPQFQAFSSGIVKPGIASQRRRLGDNLN